MVLNVIIHALYTAPPIKVQLLFQVFGKVLGWSYSVGENESTIWYGPTNQLVFASQMQFYFPFNFLEWPFPFSLPN